MDPVTPEVAAPAPTRATAAASIALPTMFEYVALEGLRTTDGEPVVVKCRRPDPILASTLLQGLPGHDPVDGEEAQKPAAKLTADEAAKLMELCSRPMIEDATGFEGPDGRD